MGFDHIVDVNRQRFVTRLNDLESQGLGWSIREQFELLTDIGILDVTKSGDDKRASRNLRMFYDRFFTFWRKACEELLAQSTFTFEDQKYWAYLDLKSPGPVVILDVDDKTWPSKTTTDQRDMEAERRLFYVAFTRAQKKVILMHEKDAPLSPFVRELGDDALIESNGTTAVG